MSMTTDIRHSVHPEMARQMDTAELRRHFLIENLFTPGEIRLTYSHTDRLIVGGITPTSSPLELLAPKAVGQKRFFDAREGGVINIGGPGRITLDGVAHDLHGEAALYIGRSTGLASFASLDPANPARFYLLSAPAHADLPSTLIDASRANRLELGDVATANRRTIFQFLHPDVVETCQLTMGMTRLDTGSIWNTMPAHTHDRRCEAYLYFGLPADQRVFHLMGEPQETRHIVTANEQAILSPSWSIHSGAGTSAYSFIWAMAGDNKDFTDMDHLTMGELK
ncbi:5-dehydro-4-deoxy-D-glucuronate isomerase [Paracoccus sp. (in: a-proteobacteria)]|uniref:5-dehydro-4-deoxy-D-glucuronate isomerase n=1 Tax=Paracoccus sp. TaxID=267 RepID=UPI002897AD55|nr:5-dehydro-4-deoxy-D-glucuronate isomerase [Paracoccus sp. (in: a-proteobacteria)]